MLQVAGLKSALKQKGAVIRACHLIVWLQPLIVIRFRVTNIDFLVRGYVHVFCEIAWDSISIENQLFSLYLSLEFCLQHLYCIVVIVLTHFKSVEGLIRCTVAVEELVV